MIFSLSSRHDVPDVVNDAPEASQVINRDGAEQAGRASAVRPHDPDRLS